MPVLRRVLPLAVAVSLAGTLTGAGVVASHLRADERRAEAERRRVAAAQALAAEEETYRTAVSGLAEELFDAVQPLQSSADAVNAEADGSYTVLSDVASKGGTVETLTSVRTRLADLTPPPTFAELDRSLDVGMEQLVRGAQAMLNSVDPDLSESSFFREFNRGDEALDKGVRVVNGELDELFTRGGSPRRATETGPGSGRPPAGKAAYLAAVGALCAPDPPEQDEEPGGLRREAAALRDVLRALIGVAAPVPDADLVRTSIVEHLERATAFAEGLEAAATAIERADGRGLAQAELQLERGARDLDEAATGFEAYGSTTCELAFGSGDEDEAPERPA